MKWNEILIHGLNGLRNVGRHRRQACKDAWARGGRGLAQACRASPFAQAGAGDSLPLLIWENLSATERLLRATISPIFFQSFPWREWYIFSFSASPLLYLRERENVLQFWINYKIKSCILIAIYWSPGKSWSGWALRKPSSAPVLLMTSAPVTLSRRLNWGHPTDQSPQSPPEAWLSHTEARANDQITLFPIQALRGFAFHAQQNTTFLRWLQIPVPCAVQPTSLLWGLSARRASVPGMETAFLHPAQTAPALFRCGWPARLHWGLPRLANPLWLSPGDTPLLSLHLLRVTSTHSGVPCLSVSSSRPALSNRKIIRATDVI